MRRDHLNILISLDEWLDAELSYLSYENDRKRGYLKTAGRACRGRDVEIIWDSVQKESRRAAIIRRFGNPVDVVRVNRLETVIKTDNAAYEFFHNYIVDDESGRKLKREVADRYYANAIVLDAVHNMVNDHHAFKMALGNVSRPKIWPSLTDAVNELNREKYPHDLPGNEKRLKERLMIYKRDGYGALIHGNFLNRHAAKVEDQNQEAILIELIAHGNNLDNEQLSKLYNAVALARGWETVSAATMGNYRQKYHLETYAGRRGETAHNNKLAMQVKRSRPTAPLYFWTLDGWDVELLYRERMSDNGKETYHHRPTVVVVLDPFLYYPIGFAVGRVESSELIQAAVRNAISHTAELFGQRYRAWQIQSDQYAIKKMNPVYKAAADKSIPAKVKNAKAKPIEPWFGRLNREYCQMMPNWSGFGIQSKKDKQPNAEVLNAKRHGFPDFEGVCKAAYKTIDENKDIPDNKKSDFKKLADIHLEKTFKD